MWRVGERWFSAAGAPTGIVAIGATMPPGKEFYENLVGVRVEDFTVVAPGETSAMCFQIRGCYR